MQFSESWLRELVPNSLTTDELSHILTMAGLEVEDIRPVAPAFSHVVVGKVLEKNKHPDADRLNVLSVDAGQNEPLTIVCGAQNVTVGMKAPCALVGAKLPGIEIKQAKVRGVASFGMMCSEKELGLAEESEGLMVLPSDALPGQSIRDYLGLDDNLFTLKLTPNRSDCLSLQGIAREVSVLTGATTTAISAVQINAVETTEVAVNLKSGDACPRYMARKITGVNAKAQTPVWMAKRLERCGIRCISAIVDVTNYVMLEMGQPLHAFDQNKLSGGLEIRFADKGEKILLLNQKEIELASDVLVIADAKGPVAVAGIMGGELSAVNEYTNDIVLESAFFSPSAIAGRARRYGFSTDSSYRFERGVDFNGTANAMKRATELILEICGGIAGNITEKIGNLPVRQPVRLRMDRLKRVLGVQLEQDMVVRILTGLGMQPVIESATIHVTPPSYRFDIAIEEDLIEEIARIHGYEAIPQLPPVAIAEILPSSDTIRPVIRLKQLLASREYHEAINFSFVEESWERDLCGRDQHVRLQNPIASQLSVMRSSLLGGLISSLKTNLARKQPRVRLYEVGGCFISQNGNYIQQDKLACVAYGTAFPEQWGIATRNTDFFDIKADLEALFAPRKIDLIADVHPASHPGRSARIVIDGKSAGWIGELHPEWQLKYDLPLSLVWFEVDVLAVMRSEVPRSTEISKFPVVRRDVAVLVDEKVSVQSLLDKITAEKIENVIEIALFDVYRGKGIENSKKSLAFRVLLQDTRKTLTDDEIEGSLRKVVVILQQSGAHLRM